MQRQRNVFVSYVDKTIIRNVWRFKLNTLQWFINLPRNDRETIIRALNDGVNLLSEKHKKDKVSELVSRLEEDHKFAKIGEAK